VGPPKGCPVENGPDEVPVTTGSTSLLAECGRFRSAPVIENCEPNIRTALGADTDILDQYLLNHVVDAAKPHHLLAKGSVSLNGMVFEPLDDERAQFP
jgi:hypothetical protein